MQEYSSEDCVVILCGKDSHGNEKSFKIDSFLDVFLHTRTLSLGIKR